MNRYWSEVRIVVNVGTGLKYRFWKGVNLVEKEEFLEKLSILIRNENFSEIDKIIKKFRDENNFEMISLS